MSPATVATKDFTVVRKGFDTAEVRSFLQSLSVDLARVTDRDAELSSEVAGLRGEVESLREQLATARHARPDELDEATVASLLGEEAARVLTTAREGAAQLRSRAQAESDAMQQQAAADIEQTRAEAFAESERIVGLANADSAAIRDDAARAAETMRSESRDEGRQMAFEARAYRERVLSDLARRRDLVKGQLRLLDLQRQRLRGSFNSVRSVLDDISVELDAYDADFPEEEDAQSITGQFPTLAGLLNPTVPASALYEPTPDAAVDVDVVEVAAVEDVVEVVEVVEVVAEDIVAVADAEFVPEVELVETVIDETAVPEASLDPVDASKVDDLFARIRAGRSETVAQLQEAPAAPPVAVDRPDPAVRRGTDPADFAALFDVRHSELAPIRDRMSRRLKRVLADEQNAVFDELRRARTVPSIEALLGDVDGQVVRFALAARPEVSEAALAGARSIAPGQKSVDAAVVDRALDELAAELVAPLRERVSRAVIESGADTTSVLDQLRSLYREVKLQRIESVADHTALVAHGRGAFAALTGGTTICWIVDPTHPCAEGDDNVLGGVVNAGDSFPTGHTHAPAYFGCRCAIAIAP